VTRERQRENMKETQYIMNEETASVKVFPTATNTTPQEPQEARPSCCTLWAADSTAALVFFVTLFVYPRTEEKDGSTAWAGSTSGQVPP
jgi:hypothetical protein